MSFVEVSLAADQPLTQQWQKGRDALTGYNILRLGLNPPRARLYERINQRAAAMFDRGLVEETERLIERYGEDCRPLTSLGYAEATAVLQNELTREQAVAQAQQGHRNYAKRQLTWFRREPNMQWLEGCGGDEDITDQALQLVKTHLKRATSPKTIRINQKSLSIQSAKSRLAPNQSVSSVQIGVKPFHPTSYRSSRRGQKTSSLYIFSISAFNAFWASGSPCTKKTFFSVGTTGSIHCSNSL